MQGVKCKIRGFLASDLKELMEIEKTSFPNQKVWPKKYFKKLYQKYPEGFFVVESEKKIVGYTIGQKIGRGAKIISLAVAPKWRERGIGRMLIKSLLNHFKKEGVKEISLHTRTKNKIGILFLKKSGFEISKKIKKYYRNGDDAYLMRKKI